MVLCDTAVMAGLTAGTLLYSQPEPDVCMMPEVGNGFVATIIGGWLCRRCGGGHRCAVDVVVVIAVP